MTAKPTTTSEAKPLDNYPPATVLVLNEISTEYGNYRILEVGIKFIYDDETNDNKVVKGDAAYGQSILVRATHNGCCRAYFCTMKVRVPGGSTQPVINTYTVDDSYCGGQLKWHLVMERQIRKGTKTMPEEVRMELVVD